MNLLHSAAKTITWGSCFLPTRIHSEHCYGAAEGCVDIYHIDCWGSGVGGKRKRVQVTMAVLAPTLDPPLESATPFVRRHWEKTSLKRGVNPRGVNAKRPKVLEGAKGPEKTKGLVPKVPKPPPALLRLKDLARWCGKPMKRYVVFGGATKIARDDAKEGCLWAKAIVSLADRDMDSCMRHVEEIRSLIGGLKGINEEHIEEAGKYISIINDAVQDTSACANVLMHV